MHCRQCGYDLKGLPSAGQCPECGLAVLETITQLVDPQASRLPRLRDPYSTGTGLLGIAVTYMLIAGLVVMPRAIPGISRILGLDWSLPGWPIPPRGLAAIAGILGLVWVWLVGRAPADEPADGARRNLRWIRWGQIGWSLSALLPVLAEWAGIRERVLIAPLEAVAVPFAIAAMLGLRGLLELVGLRSRAYRTAKGGRQSIDALVGAILAGAVGNLVAAVGLWQGIEWLETLGQTLFGASAALLLLGLFYLIVNCWWIRSALRKPPPRLEELVGAGGGQQAAASPAAAAGNVVGGAELPDGAGVGRPPRQGE